ncbi:MAG: family 43 glycosylhydrolase [Bacteroidales bacterium]|nr:family 43 glycosylhydrolase [Bacteroidales bacterium]
MRRFVVFFAAGILVCSNLCAQHHDRFERFIGKVVENPDCHDPVVAFCDGRYYMFMTGMRVLSSTDQKKWRIERNVFMELPQWASDKGFKGFPWAPDIFYHDGLWYLYYSCSGFGKNRSAIGVSVNKTLNPESPDFRWEDRGMVVESIPGRDEWNAIDPNVIIDENGDGWMVFGSFWRGIKMFKLDKTLTRIAEPQVWYPVARRPEGTAPDTVSSDKAVSPDPRGKDFDAGNGAVEAPFIFRHGEYYYLFVSFDLCCRGPLSTYNTVVGRSKCVYGPYYDKNGAPMMESGGTPVLQPNRQYAGVGHCAVISTDDGDYIYCHAYDKDFDFASKLLVRKVEWSEDGWPVVNL